MIKCLVLQKCIHYQNHTIVTVPVSTYRPISILTTYTFSQSSDHIPYQKEYTQQTPEKFKQLVCHIYTIVIYGIHAGLNCNTCQQRHYRALDM